MIQSRQLQQIIDQAVQRFDIVFNIIYIIGISSVLTIPSDKASIEPLITATDVLSS